MINLRDQARLGTGWEGYYDWAAREIEKDELAGKYEWPSKNNAKKTHK